MRAVISFAVLICVGGVLIADPPTKKPPSADQKQEKRDQVRPDRSPAKDSASDAEPESDEKPISFWMEKKLEYSQNLLRGLATADFQAISTSGRQMRTLSRVEGFVRNRNNDYRAHLNTFQRVCDEIVRQGEKENLEGATLAFNQLTVSCVSCHRSLRRD